MENILFIIPSCRAFRFCAWFFILPLHADSRPDQHLPRRIQIWQRPYPCKLPRQLSLQRRHRPAGGQRWTGKMDQNITVLVRPRRPFSEDCCIVLIDDFLLNEERTAYIPFAYLLSSECCLFPLESWSYPQAS